MEKLRWPVGAAVILVVFAGLIMMGTNRHPYMKIVSGFIMVAATVFGSYAIHELAKWRDYLGNAKGIFVEGDNRAAPTNTINHPYNAQKGWQLVVVLEAQTDGLFFYGYKPYKGTPQISTRSGANVFALRVGHEGFYAIGEDVSGNEVPLRIKERITEAEAKRKGIPVY